MTAGDHITNGVAVLTLRVRPGNPLIRLIPAGRFEAPRGALAGAGPWFLTEAAAAQIIALNAVRQAEIAIDYEHQLLTCSTNGQAAPAAGWIDPRSLTWVNGGVEPGLYGAVKWTAKAASMIAADEYRYLSPVFNYNKQTGEPTDLLNVALTNFPAIDESVKAALSAGLIAGAMAPSVLTQGELRGIDGFNRVFGHLSVLHPETDRMLAENGLDRADYLASIGA